MSVRPYVAATVATERRVKALLDEEQKDTAWWDKFNERVRKDQERLAIHNRQIDERDEREKQRAYEKLKRLPGGPLHKDASERQDYRGGPRDGRSLPPTRPSPLPLLLEAPFFLFPHPSS